MRSSKPPRRASRASAASSGGPERAQYSSTGRAAAATAERLAARTDFCAFRSPEAKRSSSAEGGFSIASCCARSSASITRHVPIPAWMVQPGPRTRHRAAGHRAERARLGRGAQVDVPDDGREEADVAEVVQEDGDGAQRLREVAWPPEHDAGEQQRQHGEERHPEEELLARVVLAYLGIFVAREAQVLHHVELPVGGVEAHLAHPEHEHHQRGHREGDAGPGVEPAADGEPAEEEGHPAEHRRPDGHPAEERHEERDRHRPVDHAGGELVAYQLVADHHVFPVAGHLHRGGARHRSRSGNAKLAHTSSPVSRAVSWGFLGPNAMKWPMAPNTAAAMAMKPMGWRTRFQMPTVVGTEGSLGRPYHSGWSPCLRTVITPVPPTPGGS